MRITTRLELKLLLLFQYNNMALHAIIIDDELDGVKTLSLLIEKFIPELKVIAQTTNALEGIDMINNYRPEVVFLDINMPILNGFQLIENLTYKNFQLVFTTAHTEYGLKALKSGAMDYLLKPLDIKEIRETLDRIKIKKVNQQFNYEHVLSFMAEQLATERFKVPLPRKQLVEYVLPHEIIYIEAQIHHSKVALVNREIISVTKPLKEYETLLCKDDEKFIRIHHSFIINVNHIKRYLKEDGGFAVMLGNKSIPISKHKKDIFLKAINLSNDA